MRSPSRDRGPSSLLLRLRSPGARRVLYVGAALGVFACSFPERTFIPADEFDKMKNQGGTAGTSGNGGSSGSGATGAIGGAGTAGTEAGGAAGAAGVGGAGGVAGTAATAGTSGEGGTGATTTGGTGGSAGNQTGGSAGVGGSGGTGTTNGLIFSEYVEGGGFNKALEIYNAGSASVSLSDCHLDKYVNAGTSFESLAFAPANTLAPGELFVLCNSMMVWPTDAGSSPCIQATSFISHNGNDGYVLVCGGSVQDSIGQIGSNVSSKWGTDPISTVDHTLRRQCSVATGDTDPNDVYDPANHGWDAFDKDDISDLGMHCAN